MLALLREWHSPLHPFGYTFPHVIHKPLTPALEECMMTEKTALYHENSGTFHDLTPTCSDIRSGLILALAMENIAIRNVSADEART